MARSLNQCNFIGNLGADPEQKFTPNGDCVCNFSIGVSDSYTKDGQKVEKTEWVRVVAWRKLGEVCGQYLKKGSKVFISGKMQTRSYEQDGVKKYATEIVINDMQMLDGKPAEQGAQQAQTARPAAQQHRAPVADDDVFGDLDIPF